MRAVRITLKHARTLLAAAEAGADLVGSAPTWNRAIQDLRNAMREKPAVRAVRKMAEGKRLTRNEETAVIRAAVIARANGRCECGCGRFTSYGNGEMDHYAGRVRQKQSAEWCWWLHRDCHRAKTDNKPDAMHWHLLFLKHARRHRYEAAAKYALNHIEAEELLRKAEEGR